MNIIKTQIVPALYDELWNDVSTITSGLTQKPVLVLTTEFAGGSLEDIQLHKMLGACKLNPDQYNIVMLNLEKKTSAHKLMEVLNPGVVFLIGIPVSMLGISASFTLNEPNNFGGRIWLPTLAISELEQKPDVKSQLWNKGMKPVLADKMFLDAPAGA